MSGSTTSTYSGRGMASVVPGQFIPVIPGADSHSRAYGAVHEEHAAVDRLSRRGANGGRAVSV
jgi:hypothetical protein